MSNSTTTSNPEISDETIRLVDDALTHFRETADGSTADADIQRLLNFITDILDDQDNGAELFLEYTSPDPVQGRQIIDRLGVDATFGDLAEAVANGTIQ